MQLRTDSEHRNNRFEIYERPTLTRLASIEPTSPAKPGTDEYYYLANVFVP